MTKLQQMINWMQVQLAESAREGWEAIKFGAPDVLFAVLIVGIVVLGSIYIHWFLALIVAWIILKNRLVAIDQMETPPNEFEGSFDR